jgi:hypothetical protein
VARAPATPTPARSRDPDADAEGRPRLAVLGGDLAAGELWRLLEAVGLDLILVAGGSAPLPALARGDDPAPVLEATPLRACLLAASGAPALEAALELVRAGWVDGIAGASVADDVLARACGVEAVAALLVRGERRVVQDSGDLRSTIALAATGLARDLGIARPRIAVCAASPPSLAETDSVSGARALGIDVRGPLPAEEAFEQPSDAVVAVTRDQARLGLLLAGRDPTARLLLGLPVLVTSEDPAEARAGRERSLRASLLLAARAARSRGELVSTRNAREAEARRVRASTVAVSARTAREDRCPYCRRSFDEDEPLVRCARCETPHHRACIHEHGRCTVHGCGGDAIVRQGVTIKVARLGGDDSRRHPFHATAGAESADGLRWLVVESPIDDPESRSRSRELRLDLADDATGKGAARGTLVSGALVLHAPRAFKASGAVLSVRASLLVLEHGPEGEREPASRLQPILAREAVVFGEPPRGFLGRLSDGLASILGTGELLSIPAGTRRYHFSFRLGGDHPASVHHRTGSREEIVTTTLEATLLAASGGTLVAANELAVR